MVLKGDVIRQLPGNRHFPAGKSGVLLRLCLLHVRVWVFRQKLGWTRAFVDLEVEGLSLSSG